ncbi:MAG: Asp-tRNA(Asn)/Glu-tRNA(Gln) amidotransferase subunit GatC [Victivallaceae bacterium]|nr:Asp-tRNA(Asn)/Glu-tRNA(Gln) amidotransferase subunit GatC [Victivallaceae bacterium]
MDRGGIDIAYVAQLARIDLDEAQAAELQRELGGIVGYIDKLNELDVSGVEPTAHAAKLVNVCREDVPAEPYDRKTMLENAPDIVDGIMIKVPVIIPGAES